MNEGEYSEEHELYLGEQEDMQSGEDYKMELSHSDIKKLWAVSGNECAICKCKLVRKKDSGVNVGQECHISSEKPDWPSKEFTRYEPKLTENERNKSIYNAIVLCANCHIIIDNPKSTEFTIEELHRRKDEHEIEVSSSKKYLENIENDKKQELLESIVNHNKIQDEQRKNKKKLKLIKPILLLQYADINYTDDFDKCNFCIDEKYPLLSDNIDLCLRKDNESLNKDIKIYNTQAEIFITELNLKIKKYITNKIPNEWNENRYHEQPQPMRYHNKRIYSEIGDYVRFCNKNQYPKRNYCLNLHHSEDGVHRWILYHVSGLVASDSKTEIIEIQNAITEMFDNAVKDVRFKKLNALFEQIKEEHKIYKKEMEKVIGDLEKNLLEEDTEEPPIVRSCY